MRQLEEKKKNPRTFIYKLKSRLVASGERLS